MAWPGLHVHLSHILTQRDRSTVYMYTCHKHHTYLHRVTSLHVHLSHTSHILMQGHQSTCTPVTHITHTYSSVTRLHAHLSHTSRMLTVSHTSHILTQGNQSTCTPVTHITHTYAGSPVYMYTCHTHHTYLQQRNQATCTPVAHIMHAYSVTHITHNYTAWPVYMYTSHKHRTYLHRVTSLHVHLLHTLHILTQGHQSTCTPVTHITHTYTG